MSSAGSEDNTVGPARRRGARAVPAAGRSARARIPTGRERVRTPLSGQPGPRSRGLGTRRRHPRRGRAESRSQTVAITSAAGPDRGAGEAALEGDGPDEVGPSRDHKRKNTATTTTSPIRTGSSAAAWRTDMCGLLSLGLTGPYPGGGTGSATGSRRACRHRHASARWARRPGSKPRVCGLRLARTVHQASRENGMN